MPPAHAWPRSAAPGMPGTGVPQYPQPSPDALQAHVGGEIQLHHGNSSDAKLSQLIFLQAGMRSSGQRHRAPPGTAPVNKGSSLRYTWPGEAGERSPPPPRAGKPKLGGWRGSLSPRRCQSSREGWRESRREAGTPCKPRRRGCAGLSASVIIIIIIIIITIIIVINNKGEEEGKTAGTDPAFVPPATCQHQLPPWSWTPYPR